VKVRNSSKSLRFKELLEFHALSSMKWKTVLSFESTETKKNMIFSVPLFDVDAYRDPMMTSQDSVLIVDTAA